MTLCACVSVYSCSNTKTTRAINTKLGRRTVRGSRTACTDPEVKRSKVKVTSDYQMRCRRGLQVDTTVV